MSATKTQALLEAAREKLGGVSDYRLAKELHIPRQRVSEYKNGKWQADNFACAKLAEILGKDALEIIAQVESETAKTQERRDYWTNFRGTGRAATLGLMLSGILGFSAIAWPSGAEAASTSHNGRLRQRPHPNNAALKGGFFLAVALTHARRKSRHRARKSTCHGTR